MRRRHGISKKGTTVPLRQDTRAVIMGLSKAALADCLADALECMADDGDVSDLTPSDVAEFCNPRLELRGDRLVATPEAPR